MVKLAVKIFICSFVVLFSASLLAAEKGAWKSLQEGIEYASFSVGTGKIHAFRVDPQKYDFSVSTASDVGEKLGASVRSMARDKKALIAINGGFFTPEYESLGLIVRNSKEINPLKKTSWWSIFYIEDKKPKIAHISDFSMNSKISMAIESGPRLLIDGRVPKLKPAIAARSALCFDPSGHVLIAATEGLFLETSELAGIMKDMGCKSALNLDGGSSTQLYAKVGSFKLDIPGINKVANAVVVLPKK